MDTFSCLSGNNSYLISVLTHQVSSDQDVWLSPVTLDVQSLRVQQFLNSWRDPYNTLRATQTIPERVQINSLATALFHSSQFRFRGVNIDRGKRRPNGNIRRICENRCKSRHDNTSRENPQNREAVQNSSRSWCFGYTTDLLKSSRILRACPITR